MGDRELPMGSGEIPMGVRGIPMGIREKPMGVRGLPMGVRDKPMGDLQIPMGKPKKPMGTRGFPIGVRGLPMGSGEIPLGSRNKPLGVGEKPKGISRKPMAFRPFRAGWPVGQRVREHPLRTTSRRPVLRWTGHPRSGKRLFAHALKPQQGRAFRWFVPYTRYSTSRDQVPGSRIEKTHRTVQTSCSGNQTIAGHKQKSWQYTQ